jgi:hypothetical protein
MTPESDLELHIEELVLHGFAPGDRHAIGEAVERELVRLFAEQGIPPALARGGEIARQDGGAFELAPRGGAGSVGTRVAGAIYRGWLQ